MSIDSASNNNQQPLLEQPQQQQFNIFQSYINSIINRNEQLNKLKRILHVNPQLIYGNEETWQQNIPKLRFLGAYNQLKTSQELTVALAIGIHLIGAVNKRVAQTYALRRAWSFYVLKKTIWIPSVGVFLYSNILSDPLERYSKEINSMNQLSLEQSYLYSSKYVKEKYFVQITNKLSNLSEDSFMEANKQKQEAEQQEQQQLQQDQRQMSNQSKNQNSSFNKINQAEQPINLKQSLKTDDYYFEIDEIIQDLQEDNFFD